MNASDKIRLGIVGCGAIARIAHLKALRVLPQFEVRVLCDRDPAVAETAKRMYGLGARVSANLRDMAGEIDAAIVCVWPAQHLAVTAELVEMGADVLCEKPVATSAADATAMAAAAARTGRIVAVGQWCRCVRGAWILRRLLGLGFLGEISAVEAAFGGELSWPMATGAYFDRKATRGGVMFDAGIHVLDLVVWLFGPVGDIRYEDDSHGGTEANGILTGTVAAGGRAVPARIAASWTHELFNGVRVTGSEGTAELRFADRDRVTIRRQVGGAPIRFAVEADGTAMPFRSAIPQEALLEDFAAALRARSAPITTAEAAAVPLAIIEEAYRVRRPMVEPWLEPWAAQS